MVLVFGVSLSLVVDLGVLLVSEVVTLSVGAGVVKLVVLIRNLPAGVSMSLRAPRTSGAVLR